MKKLLLSVATLLVVTIVSAQEDEIKFGIK